MDVAWDVLLLLFGVGCIAGFIDSIAGGGGLITIPALLATGMSPAQALATNKLQGTFGSGSATLHFWRQGQIDLRALAVPFATVAVAAALGAVVVQSIDPGFLKDVLPFLLVAVAIYFLVNPRIGDQDAHQRLTLTAFAFSLAPLIGFYDGFFGPGTGSFFAISMVALLGLNLRRATAQTKLLNFASNIGSLVLFILGGNVLWAIGLSMAAGQFLGARLGAGLVVSKGARLVRPLLVVVCLATTAKLVTQPGGLLADQWQALLATLAG